MFDDEKPKAKKDTQKLDTLDDSGNFMQTRLRGTVHQKGFWHRYVHIYILDLPNASVMMQHRAASKKIFGNMWNCCTGHVLEGEPSLLNAAKAIEEDFKISYAETDFAFLFSCKEEAHTDGLVLKQMIDVYALPLETLPRTAALAIDREEATAVKYVTLDQLEDLYRERPSDHVLVSNPEYPQRLFKCLRKMVDEYIRTLPQEDSDDERHNKKAKQLLDTMDESGVLAEPGRRGEVHRQSVWHRVVHVWVLDLETSTVLLQQRSRKKLHFGGQWYCSTGHVKMGDPSLPAAIKSIKDDLGLTLLEDHEFDFIFQARNETNTGGGCLLRQLVDVFCVAVPSATSYHRAPSLETLQLARGEVDAVRYIAVDELEEKWHEGVEVNPEFVIPCNGDDYGSRLFYHLRRKVSQFKLEATGGKWPLWSGQGKEGSA
mmetsp:Transcript_139609/g.348160  ORF Transcript_139609/g.348160 Transcript_139609/m.348160 type:complete len:430 (+) Transcript_139609:147-1436(+)